MMGDDSHDAIGGTLFRARRYSFRAAVLTLLFILSLAVPLQAVGAQGTQGTQTPLTPRAAALVGRTSATQPVTLSVALKPRDAAALTAFVDAVSTPGALDYHRYLTPQQFTDRFFDPTSRAQVTGYLRGKGLTVDDPGVGSLLTVTASTTQAERAFNVTLNDYRDAGGRIFYANDRTPALDPTVANLITDVSGLSTQVTPQPRFIPAPQPTDTGAASATQCEWLHRSDHCGDGLWGLYPESVRYCL